MVKFVKKNKILVGLAVFAVAILYVFFPVLGKYAALHAPDSMPFFSYKHSSVVWANVLGGQSSFTPHTLYWLIFNPLYAHELTYIIDTLVLSLGALYYLRGRNVSPLAAWCGALALGLSGYTFTLFCAGHRGYFHMFSCAIWAFGLLDRGFRTKKLFYFAVIGLVFAWGIPYQPDVFVLVGAVAGFYALWLTFNQSTGFMKTALSIWPRFIVMLIFLGLAGYSSIHSAATDRIADRRAQIGGDSRSAESNSDGSKKEAEPKVSPKEQWLFATNWSLPPEDMLEFIVPGVFGDESVHGAHPYWGRLGQPDTSVFQKGRMMPNYRQHTVYFGIISVVFSFFAIFVWFKFRKMQGDDSTEKAVFRDVPFWAVVWIIALLLAMGRFTPFYRLFYAIPYMGLIRAPVKFLHIVEISSALLCGFGVHALLTQADIFSRVKKQFLWFALGFVALLGIVGLVFIASKSGMIQHVQSLAAIKNADAVSAYALKNIGRTVLFLIPLLLIGWMSRRANYARFIPIFAYALLLLIMTDLALVARRYVKEFDAQPYYHENIVVKTLRKESVDSIPRVLNYAPPTQNEWFKKSLWYNGILTLKPAPSQMDSPYARVFKTLQSNPQRLWSVLNVKYLILPYESAVQLAKSGGARPLVAFEIGDGFLRAVKQPNEKTYALVALNGVSEKPRLLTDWSGGVDGESQIDKLSTAKRVLTDVESPSSKTDATGTVGVLFEQRIPAAYSIGVKTTSPVDSLLVFNSLESSNHEVLVDGVVAEQYLADGIWSAVRVPAGEHEVVLKRVNKPLSFALSLSSIILVVVLGCLTFVPKPVRKNAENTL